jgi:hypothetical protein
LVGRQPWQIVNKTLSQKYPTHTKWAGGMAQAVEGLPSKHEALSLCPSTAKGKKKKKRIFEKAFGCFIINTHFYHSCQNNGSDG